MLMHGLHRWPGACATSDHTVVSVFGANVRPLWVDMTARLMGYSACWGHRWCCPLFVEMATALKVFFFT